MNKKLISVLLFLIGIIIIAFRLKKMAKEDKAIFFMVLEVMLIILK